MSKLIYPVVARHLRKNGTKRKPDSRSEAVDSGRDKNCGSTNTFEVKLEESRNEKKKIEAGGLWGEMFSTARLWSRANRLR